MAAAAFPDDLIVQILPKLPVKSLLRFNCVCKTWYSITSDPQFSNNLHRTWRCFLLCENLRNFSTLTAEPTIKDRVQPTPLPLPWETELNSSSRIIVLGSCNGLICVDDRSSSSLIIWNPSTRKFKRVPYPIWYNFDVWSYVWFGYDESIDDYKLMWLSGKNRILLSLDVFTLKSNAWTWRYIEDISIWGIFDVYHRGYGLESKTIGVLSNGAIHWIVRHYPPYPNGSFVCILAVDLATEKFRLLKLRHALLERSPWLGSLGGCLCLRVGREVWVMEEYSVDSSWKKVLTIDFEVPHFLSFYPHEGKEIVGVYNCEAMCDGVLVLSGRIVKLRVVEISKVITFEENLLSVRTDRYHGTNGVIVLHHLHMEESLISLSN